MAKQSIKGAVREAKQAEARAVKGMLPSDGSQTKTATLDSFVNFAQGLGVGADNPLTTSNYGFNPITRNRVMLEWIHRGSWIGGMAVDVVGDDMTRAGVEPISSIPPQADQLLDHTAIVYKVWEQINATIKWSRLYGGAICVALIDGQDPRTPLNLNAVGLNQFKGLLTLDRWMVEPTLEDLVTEMGPNMGMPRYYRVQPNAPALRGQVIHYSRVMLRCVGIELPYQQQLTENLWGISVLERLYDRMIAFDSATTGAAQLVYKAYLRTLKVDGLRDLVSVGGTPLKGLYAYVDMMRRFQGIEGITMLDMKDEFEIQQSSGLFGGLADLLLQFGQQLSGALQIPLVRLFGQSPAGLNSTGESDLRMYYDGINQRQNKDLRTGITNIYTLIGRSKGIHLPPNFLVEFSPLWQLKDTEKAEVAGKVVEAVDKAKAGGMISEQTAMKELSSSSRTTGIFANITPEDIAKANAEIEPPMDEMMGALGLGMGGPEDGPPGAKPNPFTKGAQDGDGPPKPEGGAGDGARRRVKLLEALDAGGPPNRPAGEGPGAGGPRPPRRRVED